VDAAIAELAKAVAAGDQAKVLEGLKAPALELTNVDDGAAGHYLAELSAVQRSLPAGTDFTRAQIQDAVDKANAEAENQRISEQ
jgi:hypothetical protein